MSGSLWPVDLILPDGGTPPSGVLAQQAALLAAHTDGRVTASVAREGRDVFLVLSPIGETMLRIRSADSYPCEVRHAGLSSSVNGAAALGRLLATIFGGVYARRMVRRAAGLE